MANVSREQGYGVPAQEMWRRIGDFHGLESWHPAIASSESSEGGKVRTLTLSDGGQVVETLLDEGR